MAFELSFDTTYQSPFAQKARKYNLVFDGGKDDDITVVIGQVRKEKVNEEL